MIRPINHRTTTKELIKKVLKKDIAIALIIALVWQIVMTIIGNLLLPDQASTGFLHHTTLWDSGWYLNVINEHYTLNAASPAFYPLFPLTVDLLATITFHIFDYPLVGLFLNTTALAFAIMGLFAIAKHFNIKANARYVCVALFFLSPSAFFLHQFYGEAIFAAIGFWAYAFTLQKKWLYVGILLAFLTASRLPSLLFIGLCGLEYLRSYDWSVRKAFNPKLLYFLLAPFGFIAYGLYLLTVRGDFFAMFSAYKATTDWIYQSFNPNFLYTIAHSSYEVLLGLFGRLPLNSNLLVSNAIPLFSLVVLLVTSLYLVFWYRGKGMPLGITGLVSIVFFTLNNNLISVHRYTLPCLGIYIGMTLIYLHHRKLRPFIIMTALASFSIQILLIVWLYTTDKFVG